MPNLMRSSATVAFAIIVAACSGSAGSTTASTPPGSSAGSSPAVSPAPSQPDFGAIEHATGGTDIVLRYDVGGGFVPPSWSAAQTPIFTLYGDGRVVFRNSTQEGPAAQGSVMTNNPLRTAKLSEPQIQELLQFALGAGGLGVARAQYDNPMVADAGTSTFTIDAGGIKKSVAVTALGMESDGVPDQAARHAFNELATRLGDLDQGGAIATDVYEPAAYRGILMDGTGMVAPDVISWPWKDIQPSDFTGPSDPNAFQLATKTLTPDDVATLGFTGTEGGFQGLIMNGPGDGKLYSFALRPLLPDETE